MRRSIPTSSDLFIPKKTVVSRGRGLLTGPVRRMKDRGRSVKTSEVDAQRMQDYGSKMGIDATRKWAAEGFTRPWPDEILMDDATKARVNALWKTLNL